jgi:hypothetical protein
VSGADERDARDHRTALGEIVGHTIGHGTRALEAYIREYEQPDRCHFPGPITIPPDDCFMMGHNRGAFDDSRLGDPGFRNRSVWRAFYRYSAASRARHL